MSIETCLRQHLLDDPAISAAVGTRIYPLLLPQKATLPAMVLTQISNIRHDHLRGQAALARPRWQVDSWAATYDAMDRLDTLARRRLEGFHGAWTDTDPATGDPITITVTVIFSNALDLFEPDILGGACRKSSDYLIHHSTPNDAV